MPIVGLVNPGEMGASVGAAAAGGGNDVRWASIGRSEATRKRAKRAGLTDCGTLSKLVNGAEIILSVCPPHSAQDVAEAVASLGFDGIYVDANAISPLKTRQIENVIKRSGATFVDGSITGGPAWNMGSTTVLHLSGRDCGPVAALFSGSPFNVNVVSDRIGAASALKMAFAANTKGVTALLTAILGLAEQEGVRDQLESLWGDKLTAQVHRRVAVNTAKAWRFAGEMNEIADTFAAAGLPNGFHLAAARTFDRVAVFRHWKVPPSIEELLQVLLDDSLTNSKS